MKRPILSICFACILFAVRGQQFSLIKDINPGATSSNICFLTDVDDLLFFAANNGINGMELWKSDGTHSGTVLVKDINPGAASSSMGYLTAINRTLFFVANNGNKGTELWKSDGTEAGTLMIKDIRVGSLGSNPSSLVAMNGVLFFSADDGVNGVELWKSDGTEAGTVMIKDINPYSGGSYPQSLANVNGILYFSAYNQISGTELWKSDGTAAGTVMVKDIWPGSDDSYPFELINVNGTLFFSANDGNNGTELWKSNGTAAGTVMIKDIWPGSNESYPFSFKNIDGHLFFSADNGVNGIELWKTDGTANGTVLIKDIWPGTESGAIGNFSQLNNKLVFTGNDGVNGYRTWQSDGTVSGTRIASSVADPANGNMQELLETATNVFASVMEDNMGRELWAASYSSVLPLKLLEFNGKLFKSDVVLNWKTSNEVNTDEFIIERSTDKTNYSSIGKISALNTEGTHNYTFTDKNVGDAATGIIYYRLRQKDKDGGYTYSKIIAITIAGTKGSVILYPNPATTDIAVTIDATENQKLYYKVFDSNGKLILQQSKQLAAGSNRFSVDLTKMSKGVYYLNVSSNNFSRQVQFIKQ